MSRPHPFSTFDLTFMFYFLSVLRLFIRVLSMYVIRLLSSLSAENEIIVIRTETRIFKISLCSNKDVTPTGASLMPLSFDHIYIRILFCRSFFLIADAHAIAKVFHCHENQSIIVIRTKTRPTSFRGVNGPDSDSRRSSAGNTVSAVFFVSWLQLARARYPTFNGSTIKLALSMYQGRASERARTRQ